MVLRRRMGCRAHPPRVTPERSIAVVVEAIIVVFCVRARSAMGVGGAAIGPSGHWERMGVEMSASCRPEIWWSGDVDGLCGWKICLVLGELAWWRSKLSKLFQRSRFLHHHLSPPAPGARTFELSRACRVVKSSYSLCCYFLTSIYETDCSDFNVENGI